MINDQPIRLLNMEYIYIYLINIKWTIKKQYLVGYS